MESKIYNLNTKKLDTIYFNYYHILYTIYTLRSLEYYLTNSPYKSLIDNFDNMSETQYV